MRSIALIALLIGCSGGAPTPSAPATEAPQNAPAGPTQASQARIEGAWARAVPPGTPNSAIFFTVHNQGASLAEIIAGDSMAAGSVELHTHAEVDGVMKMRRVERFGVPGQGHHHLRPGGDHVMLIGLKGELSEGAEVPLTLTFADGSSLRAKVPVRGAPASAESAEHGHEHGHGHGHEHGHGHGHEHDHGQPADGTAAPAHD